VTIDVESVVHKYAYLLTCLLEQSSGVVRIQSHRAVFFTTKRETIFRRPPCSPLGRGLVNYIPYPMHPHIFAVVYIIEREG
jgi:hypothetical protein